MMRILFFIITFLAVQAVNFNIRLMDYQKSEIYDTTYNLLVTGSAGSGKTIFGAYKTLYYAFTQPGTEILVTRKTGPSLQMTCVKEIIGILTEQNLMPFCKYNASTSTLYLPNGSVIHFKSIDNLQKFRSITMDFIWVEQAEEISYADYQELKRRLRGIKGTYNQFLLIYTPEDEYHWIYKLFYENGDKRKVKIVNFFYDQNIMLREEFLQEMEELKEMDPDLWRKYGLGKFGKISGKVYNHILEIERADLPEGLEGGTACAGVDWGFNNPNVFLFGYYYEKAFYFTHEIYVTEHTNPEFIALVNQLLERLNVNHRHIYCYADFTEPSKIQEFNNKGYNMVAGCNNIVERIDYVKRSKVYVCKDLENTNREIRAYKWDTDKNLKKLDKPVDKDNHAMNSMEYCIHGVTTLLNIRLPLSPYAMAGGSSTF